MGGCSQTALLIWGHVGIHAGQHTLMGRGMHDSFLSFGCSVQLLP